MEEWQTFARQTYVEASEILAGIVLWFCILLTAVIAIAVVVGIISLIRGESAKTRVDLDKKDARE